MSPPDPSPRLLLPRPREVRVLDDPCLLPPDPVVVAAWPAGEASAVPPWLRGFLAELQEQGLRPRLQTDPGGGDRAVGIRLEPAGEGLSGPESYRLRVGAGGIRVSGGGPAGLFYGTRTLLQWLRLHGRPHPQGESSLAGGDGRDARRVTGLAVRDWPDLPHRGVLLDVSRGKVPTMGTLRGLVELLSGWKINQLQLYTEHTFAYRGHEVVWRDASPLTPEEVEELDELCARRFVELVPNQNSLGHFHQWLIHEPYRRLAECPEGIRHPFSPEPEPYGLCPVDPGSLRLLQDLYDQLLPCFRSRQFNAGLDEPLDLGRGRSARACAERGRERVYLDYLLQVRRLVRERGRRMQFWADTVVDHPGLVPLLPDDLVPLLWGYEADHDFAGPCRLLAEAGLDFYVCPGTSSWNSFAGRPANALGNLAGAARAAGEWGARGYLVADWGDNGHLQPLPVSFVGLLAGAAWGWNRGGADELLAAGAGGPEAAVLGELLDRHAFRDRAGVLGRAALELGNAHSRCGATPPNGAGPFFLLLFPEEGLEEDRYAGLTPAGLRAAMAEVERAVDALPDARMRREDADLILRELRWAADGLLAGCRLGLARLEAGGGPGSLPAPARRRLARELDELVERLREIWLARNRPGGLPASAARLERVRGILDAPR